MTASPPPDLHSELAALPLPTWADGRTAVRPARTEPGSWVGAPSAWHDDGTWWLAYRVRDPIRRGHTLIVARSADGENFTPVLDLEKGAFGAASLERPALLRTPDGTWRLYVSCAEPDSKHWWIDLLEAGDPAAFDPARRRTVLPGEPGLAVKDPVVRGHAGGWELWAAGHPTALPAESDRMDTRYATSRDGVTWESRGVALAGRAGAWDRRGARVTAVVDGVDGRVAYYDGRASAAANFEEQTGLALAAPRVPGAFTAVGGGPIAASPIPPGGLRYLDLVELDDGSVRIFYEATVEDGAHELRTELLREAPADR